MATTRYADGYTGSVALGTPNQNNAATSFSYVTGASLALAINDLLYLCKIPKGACIFDWLIWIPDLDSGTTLTLDLGLLNLNAANAGLYGATVGTSNGAIFLSASTVGQAGGLVTPTNAPNGIVTSCVPTAPILADDVLVLKAKAAAAGAGAGGTVKGYVNYFTHTTNVW